MTYEYKERKIYAARQRYTDTLYTKTHCTQRHKYRQRQDNIETNQTHYTKTCRAKRTHTETKTRKDSQSDKYTDIQIDRWTDRQPNDKYVERQIDKRLNIIKTAQLESTDIHMYIHTKLKNTFVNITPIS